MGSVQPESELMTTYNEFMPWQTWRSLPQNRDLPNDEALRKFNVERDAQLKRMIYYENQQKIRDNQK